MADDALPTPAPTEPRARPTGGAGPLAWLRANLFSSVGNGVTTMLVLAVLAWILPKALGWLVFDAVWGPQPASACDAVRGQGACWAVVWEKMRFMLFGVYPFDQQWRPGLVVVILTGLLVVSAFKRFWRPALAAFLAVGAFVTFWLMGGGLGLTPVRTEQWGGLPVTLILAIFGIAFAFPLGIVLALGRRSKLPIIRSLSVIYIEVVRGVPLITVLFMANVMLPLFLPPGWRPDSLLRVLIGVAMFASAYMAEVVRGGLQAMPKGQYEGAMALGLSYPLMMIFVILPQALKLVIPGIVNTFIGLFKDTSLVAIVGIFDLMKTIEASNADPKWATPVTSYTGYLFAAIIYFIFCFGMSRYSLAVERRLDTGHKR